MFCLNVYWEFHAPKNCNIILQDNKHVFDKKLFHQFFKVF